MTKRASFYFGGFILMLIIFSACAPSDVAEKESYQDSHEKIPSDDVEDGELAQNSAVRCHELKEPHKIICERAMADLPVDCSIYDKYKQGSDEDYFHYRNCWQYEISRQAIEQKNLMKCYDLQSLLREGPYRDLHIHVCVTRYSEHYEAS